MGVKVREKNKGSGIWWIFIDHRGRRKAKKIGKNKKLALKVAREFEAKLVLGELKLEQEAADNFPTFDDYAVIFRDVLIPATCKASTASDYNGLMKNHILPKFKNMRVDEIKKMAIKSFLMKKYNKGYNKSTVTHMKNVISGILNLAVDDEVIPVNPAHDIGKIFKKEDSSKDSIDPLNQDELAILLDTFKNHFPEHYPVALTLARTGIRLGECFGLQWSDIDFDGRFITIQRSLSRNKIETPKNGKVRKIDMSLQLADTLRELKHSRKVETLKNGWKRIPKWVFVNKMGNPLNNSNWRNRVFYEALKKAELRKVRIHDLRHTYATLRIAKGDNIADVSNQLGHHSVKFTMDIYYHWIPGGNKSEVDALDDLGRNQAQPIRNQQERG